MNHKDKVIFVMPVTSQPRYHKRIASFRDLGYETLIFSFEREYFKGKTSEMQYVSLGKIQHRNYFKRIKVFLNALSILSKYRKHFEEASVVYVFGLDIAIMMLLLNAVTRLKMHIVLEVADIRGVLTSKAWKGKILRYIEKTVISHISLVTVTSPYFVKDYYKNIQQLKEQKFYVLENKLLEPIPLRIEKRTWDGKRPLKLGLFGVLRCNRSWDILYKLAKEYPDQIEVYIRGHQMGLNHFEDRVNELDNIIYEGEYVSPDDLAEIYSKIDVTWLGNVSDNSDNIKWALPNRLYESIYYKVPMIVHTGSAVARRVEELSVGWNVDFFNEAEAVEKILKLTPEEYVRMFENTTAHLEYAIGTKDNEELVQRCKNL